MRFLDSSRRYFEQYGLPLLAEFGLAGRAAAGLVGRGSECFGYDDALSRDHDLGPGFCIWLSDADLAACGGALQQAYEALPRRFEGFETVALSRGAERRRGVFSVSGFYEALTGCPGVPPSLPAWLAVPQYALAEATNGAVFRDGVGAFSAVRTALLRGYPEDVRRAKLAAALLTMAQSGQYNFPRCLAHGEPAAAALALAGFAKAAVRAAFLLENRYAPYYKWAFRALRELPGMNRLSATLEFLLAGDGALPEKERAIERAASYFAERLRAEGFSGAAGSFLESHAYAVKEKIEDEELRALHILSAE